MTSSHMLSRVMLGLVLLLAALGARGAGEPLTVWQVSKGEHSAILLGSVHMAYPELYPLRPEILDAFDAAEVLAVEVDIRPEAAPELQALMLSKGQLPADDSLSQHLQPDTWAELQRYLKSRGLPEVAFTRLHPGLVVMMLSSMRIAEMGMRPEYGVDLHFLSRLGPQQSLAELESAEQQLELLIGFENGDLLVRQTLEQLNEIDLYLRPLYDAWLAGDAATLEKLLLEESDGDNGEFAAVTEALFDTRNIAMTEKITRLLADHRRSFVVVGAGHLVGEQGIVALLKRQGYRVTPF